MEKVYVARWSIVQEQSTMYSQFLNEGKLVQEKHNGGLVGHFCVEKTPGQLSHFYFWPKMKGDVQRYVSKCRVCQHVKIKKVGPCKILHKFSVNDYELELPPRIGISHILM